MYALKCTKPCEYPLFGLIYYNIIEKYALVSIWTEMMIDVDQAPTWQAEHAMQFNISPEILGMCNL